MKDTEEAVAEDEAGARDAAVEAELASLVDVFGLSTLNQPDRIRAILEQTCPGETRHIDALMIAVRAEIPQRLRVARPDDRLPALLAQCVRQINQNDMLDATWATWAVRAWAHALALPTTSLAVPDEKDRAAAVIEPAAVPSPAPSGPFAFDVENLVAKRGEEKAPPVEIIDPAIPSPMFRETEPSETGAADEADSAPATQIYGETRSMRVDTSAFPWEQSQRPPRRLARTVALVFALIAVAAGVAYVVLDRRDEAVTVAPAPAATRVEPPPVAAAPPPPVEVAPTPPAVVPETPQPEPAVVSEALATIAPSDPAPTPAPPVPTAVSPVIERIDVPRIAEGVPFAVALRASRPPREIVAVERRFVDATGAWTRTEARTEREGLRRTARVVMVPFAAVRGPARATVEFVAVAADGSKSEPKRVVLALAAAAPTVAATGCAYATCGVVVSARQVDTALYQITVRMDDSTTQSLTAPYRLADGMRVQLVAGRFVPIAADGRTRP